MIRAIRGPLACVLFALFVATAASLSAQSIDGAWTLALDTDPAQSVDATIAVNGQSATAQISSQSGPVDAQGTYVDGVLTLYYTSYLNGQPAEITLSASLTEGGMEGALRFNNQEIWFTGKRKS